MIDISQKSIIVCGIVRDAELGLRRNIPVIKDICSRFKSYNVVIFENNSIDKTKLLLNEWALTDSNVTAMMEDYESSKTIPESNNSTSVNPFFSAKRINKMAMLRNQYLEYIRSNNLTSDYVMVVDLDVANIDADGVLSTFKSTIEDWDAVAANGYSYSPKLRKRYHDTYALVEFGEESTPQTEKSIYGNSMKFQEVINNSKSFIRVFSAFGGLIIYRYETLKDCHYKLMRNNDDCVEVRCEHFALHFQMSQHGFNKIYVNPKMKVKYQAISCKLVAEHLKRKITKLTFVNRRGGVKQDPSLDYNQAKTLLWAA